jgi:lipid-binding SYLF domain-containing protein
MRTLSRSLLVPALLMLATGPAFADSYADALATFKGAGQSGQFFGKCYGYALFPTIGKGGIGIGGAHGKGRVYRGKSYVGDATMNQITVGLQLGGQAYSQVIFFETKEAFESFIGGNFEFGAQATAVALTAGASASAGTSGAAAGASGTKEKATTAAKYMNGMAVFTIAKGGLMYEASIGGQKFSYEPASKKAGKK